MRDASTIHNPDYGFMLNFHIVEGIKRLNTGPEACF